MIDLGGNRIISVRMKINRTCQERGFAACLVDSTGSKQDCSVTKTFDILI